MFHCWMRSAATQAVRLNGFLSAGRVVLAPTTVTLPLPPTLLQPTLLQQRLHWTKAKKKRFARKARRARILAAGHEIPKPGYYTPFLPVKNSIPRAVQIQMVQEEDKRDAAELHRRTLEQKAKPPPLRLHMSESPDLKMSDRVRKLFALHNGNQKEVVAAQKAAGMELFQIRTGDTGSSAVQVVALTTRIQALQTHMRRHRKDVHNKRGLQGLMVRRRKVLDYLARKDFAAYRKVVKTLGLVQSK